MRFLVRTENADRFAERLRTAFKELARAAKLGSDEAVANAPELAPYRAFFPPPMLPDAIRAELAAWRAMAGEDRAKSEATKRWDIQNVLYMLGPEMRTWDLIDVRIERPDVAVIDVSGMDFVEELGVLRQLVEFAGGHLT